MKKILVITAAAFMFVSGYAVADEATSSSTVNAGQQQGQQQLSVAGDYYESGASRTASGTQQIRYSGGYDLDNVPNVVAPALTTTLTETCMGSSSVGGAVSGFGLSFGTTWRDSACVRRLDSRELNSLGYTLGAKELMCDSDKVRAALKRAGTPCWVDRPEAVDEPREIVAPAPVAAPVIPAGG